MTLRLGLGVFGMQAVPQRPDHHVKLYRDLLEDADLAEALGFDSIWLSEHHFWFDGYCPADIAAAGAILGHTRRLGVGTAVMLLPMHSVEKVAADAATMSRLGEGRVSLGASATPSSTASGSAARTAASSWTRCSQGSPTHAATPIRRCGFTSESRPRSRPRGRDASAFHFSPTRP